MNQRANRRQMIGGGLTAAAWFAARNGTAMAVPRRQATPVAPEMKAEVSGNIRYLIAPSGPNEAPALQAVFDGPFRERYPNLRVSVEVSQGGGGQDQLLTSMVAGEAPDIFDAWTSRATPYIDAGQVLDLAPLVARDYSAGALDDFFPWVLAAQTLPNGFQWGMPRYVNITTLVYNKDLVDEAGVPDPTADDGWSADQYRAAMIALTQRQGDRVRVFGAHIPVYFYGPFAYKLEGWGATPVDPNDPSRATFGSEAGQACAEWHRELLLDERVIVDKGFLDTGGGQGVVGAIANFGARRLATMESGFYPFSLADGVGDAFRFGFAPPPAGPVARPVQGSADGFAIWADSPNQEAAWEVVKYASGEEYQRELARVTGLIPVRRSLIPEYQEIVVAARPQLAEANLGVALRLLETGDPHERPLFAEDGEDYVADAEAEQIINAGLEKIFVVGDTPVSYLVDLAEQVTRAMQTG